MAPRLVKNTLLQPDLTPIVGAVIEIQLVADASTGRGEGWIPGSESSVIWRKHVRSQAPDEDDLNGGLWSVELEPNANIEPANTYYKVTEDPPGRAKAETYYIQVPAGSGDLWARDILVEEPASPEPLYLLGSQLEDHVETVKDHDDWSDTAPSTGQVPIWNGSAYVPGDTVATDLEVTSAITTHNADTTDVHGIPDTSVLATDAEVASAVAAEATLRGNADTAHEADTTNIHGIADTSALVVDGDAAGGVLSGTYPSPGFAVDMATQAELDAEATSRAAADTAEATARASADTALDGRLDTAEEALSDIWVNVKAHGVTMDGSTDDTGAMQDLIDTYAAGGVLFMPEGTLMTTGLSLVGKSCVLRGPDSSLTTVKAIPGITGPVIDMDDYVHTFNFMKTHYFGGFSIEGDNTADATKTHTGIEIDAANVAFRDIAISKTGGPGMKLLTGAFLCEFENITLGQPVSAQANDVPYLHMVGAVNGNRFIGLGLRSIATNPEGASGAILIENDGTDSANANVFYGCWDEFMHVPQDGSIVTIKGNRNVISDWSTYDSVRVSGATGTCRFRISPPSGGADYGGNIIRGVIPGNDSGAATDIGTGVVIGQSRNRIEGIKGYNGNNVEILSGVEYTYVELGGAQAGVGNTTAVVDNSGEVSNVVIDAHSRFYNFGRFNVGGSRKVDITAVGNVGAGEDDLITYSLIGSALPVDGDYVEFEASGTFAATAATKRIRVKFGSDTLLDTGALAITDACDWVIRGKIVRTGAATQQASTTFMCTSATVNGFHVDNTAPTETLSAANTLKCTGEAASDNDIVQSSLIVKWMPHK